MNLSFLDRKKFIHCANDKACLVVGDIILDRYIYGQVNRISPEAPIPVVKMTGEKQVLGGAANVAGNICGFHMRTLLSGILGEDADADIVQRLLKDKGIEFAGFCSKERPTTVKTRVVGMNQQLLRIDSEEAKDVSVSEEEEILKRISDSISKVQMVVLSDYGKGVCSASFCGKLMGMAQEYRVPVIVDPKCSDWSKYRGAYLITPNFKEFQEAAGSSFANTEKEIADRAGAVMGRYDMSRILITRSQYGMTLVQKSGMSKTFQAIQQEVYDVSGAGDTVIATIAAFLSAGYELAEALTAANYAAGFAVSKTGTYMVSLEEVLDYVNPSEKWYEEKVCDAERMEILLNEWRTASETIVFTNGCFDILHAGHVDYLNHAKMLGGKMIIGLNSDASVRRLKGDSRPINPAKARANLLAALQCVDAVVIFEEDTPEKLIERIRPDFLVKGNDYRPEDIAGRQYAGEVRTIPLTEGYSTTGLVEKMRQG